MAGSSSKKPIWFRRNPVLRGVPRRGRNLNMCVFFQRRDIHGKTLLRFDRVFGGYVFWGWLWTLTNNNIHCMDCLFVCLFDCLFACLFVCLLACLFVCFFVSLLVCAAMVMKSSPNTNNPLKQWRNSPLSSRNSKKLTFHPSLVYWLGQPTPLTNPRQVNKGLIRPAQGKAMVNELISPDHKTLFLAGTGGGTWRIITFSK